MHRYHECDLDHLDQRWQATAKHVSRAVVPVRPLDALAGKARGGKGGGARRRAIREEVAAAG